MQPTIWIAFVAGFLSFLSPCVLPLYPTYLSYISGISLANLEQGQRRNFRLRAVSQTFFFVLGFSLIFFALGLSATAVGHLFILYRSWIRIIGGVLIIGMGLFVSGWFVPSRLMQEKKWHYQKAKVSYIGSFFVGISFAAGWTPCIGPILSSVLVLATIQASAGMALISAYIVGFSLPFFVFSATLSSLRSIVRYGAILSKIGGYGMIVMGILLVTNWISQFTIQLIQLYGGFTGF